MSLDLQQDHLVSTSQKQLFFAPVLLPTNEHEPPVNVPTFSVAHMVYEVLFFRDCATASAGADAHSHSAASVEIPFVLVKDRDRSIVTGAKIVPYETVAPQHRPLICTIKISPAGLKQIERCGARPGRRKVDKQTWLWTDDVKAKIREKKSLYHVFLGDRTADNWEKYQKAKKAAKKAVAVAKATHYSDVNEKLASRDGERYFYRLAMARHRQTEDIEKFFGINDESGHLLTDRKKALKR
ncbi:unnamed protein product [Heligmosomoides polygyrus]|uniref:60S ribosomal protein L14 n=1 Tax=Heligmosomoides polygyrus TaxID=6339 RepID=A0A183G076_HELPZ|nr:unnamed protein product [Heligmosomoides polygyrus]